MIKKRYAKYYNDFGKIPRVGVNPSSSATLLYKIAQNLPRNQVHKSNLQTTLWVNQKYKNLITFVKGFALNRPLCNFLFYRSFVIFFCLIDLLQNQNRFPCVKNPRAKQKGKKKLKRIWLRPINKPTTFYYIKTMFILNKFKVYSL